MNRFKHKKLTKLSADNVCSARVHSIQHTRETGQDFHCTKEELKTLLQLKSQKMYSRSLCSDERPAELRAQVMGIGSLSVTSSRLASVDPQMTSYSAASPFVLFAGSLPPSSRFALRLYVLVARSVVSTLVVRLLSLHLQILACTPRHRLVDDAGLPMDPSSAPSLCLTLS